jgi:hypothetical protein
MNRGIKCISVIPLLFRNLKYPCKHSLTLLCLFFVSTMDPLPPDDPNNNNNQNNGRRAKEDPPDGRQRRRGGGNGQAGETMSVIGNLEDSPVVVAMFLVGVVSWLLRERCIC